MSLLLLSLLMLLLLLLLFNPMFIFSRYILDDTEAAADDPPAQAGLHHGEVPGREIGQPIKPVWSVRIHQEVREFGCHLPLYLVYMS